MSFIPLENRNSSLYPSMSTDKTRLSRVVNFHSLRTYLRRPQPVSLETLRNCLPSYFPSHLLLFLGKWKKLVPSDIVLLVVVALLTFLSLYLWSAFLLKDGLWSFVLSLLFEYIQHVVTLCLLNNFHLNLWPLSFNSGIKSLNESFLHVFILAFLPAPFQILHLL